MSLEIENHFQVVCRFRPNVKNDDSIMISISQSCKSLCLFPKLSSPQEYSFDFIFPESSNQSLIYKTSAKPIIRSVLEGFNGTIIAYGQTSSGKTFTITGDLNDNTQKGIIPRMLSTLYKEALNPNKTAGFQIKFSSLEVYMEKINDLLNPNSGSLKIRESNEKGVFVEGLTEVCASEETEAFDIIRLADENKKIGATSMNTVSSRSHSVLIVSVRQTDLKDFSVKTGKMYCVDLAGSEKVSRSHAVGMRLEEAKTINKSLTILGMVINALTDNKSVHIPYRDSKITRILQESLGGNSKTCLIITCSPLASNEAETISTLQFGLRAKNVKNSAKVNKEYTIDELKSLLSKAQDELKLKDKLIAEQKEAIDASAHDISRQSMNTSIRIYNADESYNKSEGLDEVLSELGEIKTKFEVQSRHFRRASVELQGVLIEKEENNKVEVFIYEQLQELEQKLLDAEVKIRSKDLKIVKLLKTVEDLKSQLVIERKKLFGARQKVGYGKSKLNELGQYYSKLLQEMDYIKLSNREFASKNSDLLKKLYDKHIYLKTVESEQVIRNIIERPNENAKIYNCCERVEELCIESLKHVEKLESELKKEQTVRRTIEFSKKKLEIFVEKKSLKLESVLNELTMMINQLINKP